MKQVREPVVASGRPWPVLALLGALLSGQTPALAAAPLTSELGAHTLLTQAEGDGRSPATTLPLDTAAQGSALLVFNGGYASNDASPSDSYGNRWHALSPPQPYGNGYGDRFDVKAYWVSQAKGGPGHTVSLVKRGQPGGEISLPFIEIRHAGRLQAMAQNYAPAGLVVTSGKVTTTGPALLVALWWGDGAVKHISAVPSEGFTVIERFLQLPDNSGVQCAVAIRQVQAAGTYDVSWIDAPAQGALLWLLAFQA